MPKAGAVLGRSRQLYGTDCGAGWIRRLLAWLCTDDDGRVVPCTALFRRRDRAGSARDGPRSRLLLARIRLIANRRAVPPRRIRQAGLSEPAVLDDTNSNREADRRGGARRRVGASPL